MIYVWNGTSCGQTLGYHKGGFVGAIRFSEGKIYSGGKDGNICIINPADKSLEKSISLGSVLIRAIDV